MKALGKLTTVVDGQRRIISDPPTIVPVEEVFSGVHADAIYKLIGVVLGKYRRTMQSDRRHLLEQFNLVQVARKVVGVGSVGTPRVGRADGRRRRGRAAVPAGQGSPGLGPGGLNAGRSRYAKPGRSVSSPGSPLQQAQSDIFLGWTLVTNPEDGVDRDFYVRQLRDWKFSVPIEGDAPARHGGLRPAVRVDPGPGARPLRRPHRPGRLPRRVRQVRPGHRRLRRNLRRPERTRLRALQAAVKDGKAEPSPKSETAPMCHACNGWPGNCHLAKSSWMVCDPSQFGLGRDGEVGPNVPSRPAEV